MPNVKTRGRAWPFAIAGILVAGIASNVGFVIVATSDPAAAIEPEYYRKALAWDQEMAQQERNIALGWSAHAALRLGTAAVPARLELQLADSTGHPLLGAAVTALVMHNARAADVRSVTLREEGKGRYAASFAADRPGVWEIRLDVEKDSRRFTARERVQAAPPT